jgi:hypothetical protein
MYLMATQTAAIFFLTKLFSLCKMGITPIPINIFRRSLWHEFIQINLRRNFVASTRKRKNGIKFIAYQKYRTLLSLTDNNTMILQT